MLTRFATRVGPIVVLVLAVAVGDAAASDEESRDHGSRATRQSSANLKGVEYHLGLFGGLYAQDRRFGLMGEAGIEYSPKIGKKHRLEIGGNYLHEPFSTKTFNFPEVDETPGQPTDIRESRLAQRMHIVDGATGWKARWKKWYRTTLRVRGDAWWPQFARDQRWSLRARAGMKFGKSKGAYGRVRGEYFFKKFPNYRVADRTIDQQGVDADAEAGYVFPKHVSVAAGLQWRFTDYLDARYDVLPAGNEPVGPDIVVVRSQISKDYVSYRPFAEATLKPGFGLRFKARYSMQLHDSRNYDRRMTGREPDAPLDPQMLVRKFVPNYYDYVRHRVSLRARWRFRERLEIELLSEAWRRNFRTYEARDAENRWTGELRQDTSIEAGAEVAILVHGFDGFGLEHGLYVTTFASHLQRYSNMKREVSLATNFGVTRAFAGFELRTR